MACFPRPARPSNANGVHSNVHPVSCYRRPGARVILGAMATPLPRKSRGRSRWLPWIFGALMVAAVVVAALHDTEWHQFLALMQRSQPRWLLVAVLLQAATYLAQGEVWREVARAANARLSLARAFVLSLAK